MADCCILYNPLAGNGRCAAESKKLAETIGEARTRIVNICEIGDYSEFFESLAPEESIIVCGGDGTLNRFVNDTDGIDINCDVYYFAAGSGNDFLRDVGSDTDGEPICINRYIRDLPEVTVKGKTYKFINGIGYGIDGYCCEEGDAQREISDKPVNYTAIAISGLLFHYHPTNATVVVDGREHRYKRVWLAPTMNGRCYGGGMMPTPAQDRLNSEGTVSTMVYYGAGKLRALMVFPSIFKGEHVKHTGMVEILTGNDITVRFDAPTALQIDGETVTGVTEYSVHSHARSTEPCAAKQISGSERNTVC